MDTLLSTDAESAFAVGHAMEDVAEAMKLRRHQAYAAGKLTPEEYEKAAAREIELRGEAARMVAVALGDVLEAASLDQRGVEEAIREAEMRIKTIRTVKSAFEIATTLITLATALYSGSAKSIGKAFAAFVSAVKESSETGEKNAADAAKSKKRIKVAKRPSKTA